MLTGFLIKTEYVEEASVSSLHRRIYIDEFLSILNRKNFTPPKEAEQFHTNLEIREKVLNVVEKTTHQQSQQTVQKAHEPTDLNTVLEKLYVILDKAQEQLTSAPLSTEEKDRSPEALTVPLLKLFQHHDSNKKGIYNNIN